MKQTIMVSGNGNWFSDLVSTVILAEIIREN